MADNKDKDLDKNRKSDIVSNENDISVDNLTVDEIDTKEEAIAVIESDVGIDEFLERSMTGKNDTKKAKKEMKEKILMTAGIGKNIVTKNIDLVMHESMLPYSEHVILDRALPRVEDGLKPVQRRILYTMLELGVTPDKPHRKSARIVGDCLGKYHPHGDSSVYDAMVRMAQPFNMRGPLVDGHGNFGSIDGDCAAAMRYTEARMTPLAMEMLRDLEKDTVPWMLNFDDSLKEPCMLPSRYPNLLVNGAYGIAVGLATNIPPHNLIEVINGACALIDNRNITLDEMMKYVPAPDFPTGGYVVVGDDLKRAYETGKGKLYIRAKINIEGNEGDKQNIVISELPYQVNKAILLQKILELRDAKKDVLAGISEICDESDRNGMRAVIRIKKDADPKHILDILFKNTDLETSFAINMVAIADGKPQQMGLLDILAYYVDYQREIIVRRTKFDLEQAKERAHILEGLVIACKNIDEVIRIIKKSANVSEAKSKLRDRFNLSDRQAQAILDMRLAKLTSLEVLKLEQELAELKALITKLTAILNSKKLQFETVKAEMQEIKKKYIKDVRRSKILTSIEEFSTKDVEAPSVIEPVVLASNEAGGLKRMTLRAYNIASKEFSEKTCLNDIHNCILQTMSDKNIIAFTNLGNAFKFVAGDAPDGRWRDKGALLKTFVAGAKPEEKVVAMFEVDGAQGDLLFISKKGMLKRTNWTEYQIGKNFYQATKFKDDDALVSVEPFDEQGTILFVTKNGMALNADKTDIPVQGRISGGVKGVSLNNNDELLYARQLHGEECFALVSNTGYAKKVKVGEVDISARYRKGLKIFDLKTTSSGFKLVFAGLVKDDFDIVFMENDICTCFSTSVMGIEPRISKGKLLGKKSLDIKSAYLYLNH